MKLVSAFAFGAAFFASLTYQSVTPLPDAVPV